MNQYQLVFLFEADEDGKATDLAKEAAKVFEGSNAKVSFTRQAKEEEVAE